MQTVKSGKVEDQGPHARDWGPQEEFIAETESFSVAARPTRSLTTSRPKTTYWVLGSAAIALWALFMWRQYANRSFASIE